jgi:predicted amidohydrolase YtcJ
MERTLFSHGTVHTLDAAAPQASWVLVESGRVLQVGRGEPMAGSAVRHVDLGGRTLVPGFTDAHVHLTWIATSFLGPDLTAASGVTEVLDAVERWQGGGRGPQGDWIVGDGFDETPWKEKRLPSRDELDAIEPRRPVLVKRVCGHIGVVNSKALEALPPGAHTDRDSGRIAETDLWSLNDRLRPGPGDLQAVLPRIVETLQAHGITAVHDVTSTEMLQALQAQNRAGRFDMRVTCSLPADQLAALESSGVQCGLGDARLRVLGIKVFVDGSLGAHTAFLRQPYSDAPKTRGVALYSLQDLEQLLERGERAGLQLMVHAIGDAALELLLDCFPTRVGRGNSLRHRLEHIEVTPPDLVQRLAASGLWACVQPNFAGRWSQPGGMNEQRLGKRLAHCNAYRTLHEAGVPFGFGSDCMPLGPLFGLQSAVEHPDVAQRLDPATALAAYTKEAAHLVHAETEHGQIRPGMAADFAVLSADPLTEGPWPDVRVDATIVAGRPVFVRPGSPLEKALEAFQRP